MSESIYLGQSQIQKRITKAIRNDLQNITFGIIYSNLKHLYIPVMDNAIKSYLIKDIAKAIVT